MKKASLFLVILLFVSKYTVAQTDSLNYPVFAFETTVITDTIYLDSAAKRTPQKNYTFHFTNAGNVPLIIMNMNSSDPCFACEYPREPILPGKKGTIKVCCPELYGSKQQVYYIAKSNAKENPVLKTITVVIRR